MYRNKQNLVNTNDTLPDQQTQSPDLLDERVNDSGLEKQNPTDLNVGGNEIEDQTKSLSSLKEQQDFLQV